MLFLDGVDVERPGGSLRLRWRKAPARSGSTRRARTLALRAGRRGTRRTVIRAAAASRPGRELFLLRALPPCDEPSMTGGQGGRSLAACWHGGECRSTWQARTARLFMEDFGLKPDLSAIRGLSLHVLPARKLSLPTMNRSENARDRASPSAATDLERMPVIRALLALAPSETERRRAAVSDRRAPPGCWRRPVRRSP